MIDFACKKFDLREIIKCSLGLSKAEVKILEFFVKEKTEYYSSQEISKSLSLDLTTVQRGLKKLHEKGMLTRRQLNKDLGGYLFEYKLKNKKECKDIIMGIIHSWTNKVEKEICSW